MFSVVKTYCDLVCSRSILKLVLPPDITTPLSTLVEGEDSLPVGISMENVRFVDPAENLALGNLYLAWHVGYLAAISIGQLLGLLERTEERYIHLSGKLVQRWRDDCQKELEGMAKNGELLQGDGTELTKNDIITAWYLKVAFSIAHDDIFSLLSLAFRRPTDTFHQTMVQLTCVTRSTIAQFYKRLS